MIFTVSYGYGLVPDSPDGIYSHWNTALKKYDAQSKSHCFQIYMPS